MEPKVRVVYRNDEGKVVSKRDYLLTDYVGVIQTDLFRIISDIEGLYYRLNDGKPKRNWAQEDVQDFEALKHKLLDKAGEIERLPSSMILEEEPNDGIVARTQLKGLGI